MLDLSHPDSDSHVAGAQGLRGTVGLEPHDSNMWSWTSAMLPRVLRGFMGQCGSGTCHSSEHGPWTSSMGHLGSLTGLKNLRPHPSPSKIPIAFNKGPS